MAAPAKSKKTSSPKQCSDKAMNFELNDVQTQLRDSVVRTLANHYSFEKRRAISASGSGWSRAIWQQLAELGVTALPVPEAHGGFGGSAVDLLPLLQAAGSALLLEPVMASIVLGTTALRLSEDASAQAALLPAVASGALRLAWAHDEPGTLHAPIWIETAARQHQGVWLLDGSKINVLHAEAAGHFIVTGRISGTPDDRTGIAVFLVAVDTPGLQRRLHRLVDDTPAGGLTFVAASAQLLGDSDNALAVIEGTISAGIAAACADMVGAMEAAYQRAVDYLNVRKQFGRLLAENQTLRHRAAEMLVSLEMCRSMAIAAAIAADNPGGPDSQADLLRAKLLIGHNARALCQNAIQMHGGIGMTEEYAVGYYLRRVTVLDQLFGDSNAHTKRLAAFI
jgi:pimeloyl-CoA dehydrogenase